VVRKTDYAESQNCNYRLWKSQRLARGSANKNARITVCSVYSRNREKAKRYGEKYGVQGFSDIQEMIVSAGVEAVIICTPHPHIATQQSLPLKPVAHILVEKPLASSLQDCDDIKESQGKDRHSVPAPFLCPGSARPPGN